MPDTTCASSKVSIAVSGCGMSLLWALVLWLVPITVNQMEETGAVPTALPVPRLAHLSLRHRSSGTASRAEAMAGGTAAVLPLLLLLLTGSLALYWQRQEDAFTDTPDATVSAAYVTICAIRCAGTKLWSCTGFTYLHNTGTCQLYRGSGDDTCVTTTTAPLTGGDDSGPRSSSYRLRQNSTCSGEQWRWNSRHCMGGEGERQQLGRGSGGKPDTISISCRWGQIACNMNSNFV